MSYTELDAWLEEKATGDWPFERWILPSLELRQDFDYLTCIVFDSPVLYRLQGNFGHKDRETLIATLREAKEVVEGAIEHSEAEAYCAWLDHSVWLPTIDDSIRAGDHPAHMLVESIDLVGTREFTPRQVCAAMGLWCYGEYLRAIQTKAYELASDLLHEVALALAESEWYRGMDEQVSAVREATSKRNRDAAKKGHEPNRQNKLRGFAIWDDRAWKIQADAEREIVKQCNITQQVAGRWVREFKRAPDAYRAELSKYRTAQRP